MARTAKLGVPVGVMRMEIARQFKNSSPKLVGVKAEGLRMILDGKAKPGDEITYRAHLINQGEAGGLQALAGSGRNGVSPDARVYASDDSLANTYQVVQEEQEKEEEEPMGSHDEERVDKAVAMARALLDLTESSKGTVDVEEVERIALRVVEEEFTRRESEGPAISSVIRVESHNAVYDVPGTVHHLFPLLLRLLGTSIDTGAGKRFIPLYIVGSAGWGKTKGFRLAAEALGLPLYIVPCNGDMSPHELLGYKSPMGEFVEGYLYQWTKNGGILLLDEADRLQAGTLAALNNAIEGETIKFPNGEEITKHETCRVVATANTFGTGPNRTYTAANALDAASTDRFFMLEWSESWSMLAGLVGVKEIPDESPMLAGAGITRQEWYSRVKKASRAAKEIVPKHVIGPRAVLMGCALLGFVPLELLEDGLLWKGLPQQDRERVLRQMGGN